MLATDATGLLACAIAIGGAGAAAGRRAGLASGPRLAIAGAATLAALVPIGALPAAAYLRGAIGDPSVTTLVLLALATGGTLLRRAPVSGDERLALQVLVAAAAVVLYPLALGALSFDPYALGYASPWLMGGLGVVSLALWARGFILAPACLALAVLAYSVGWYESRNVWDYLLDPLVSVYALAALARRAVATRRMP